MDRPGNRARVVIVGAGFGGLEAARSLASADVDVTLLDRHNYHCFQPLLYQVATAALSPADIAWPIRGISRHRRNLTILMAEVIGVDTTRRLVRTKAKAIPYDFLVLAMGAAPSYFGHDDWAEAAPGLKEIDDATRIRRRILVAFERAEATDDEEERRRLLTFVIIGGGPTGVELAGAVVELARHSLPFDFRRFDPRSARILLIEAGPRLLLDMPEDVSAYVQRTLEAMSVHVLTGVRVTACDEGGVSTEPYGRIEARTLVWAAGVRPSSISQWLGVKANRAGRIGVEPDLSVPGLSDVFVIGDSAVVFDADNRPVPGTAAAAKQMGRYVGKVIGARVAGTGSLGRFRYHHAGDLVTIGRKVAVVRLPRLQLRGFAGWLFWSIVHIYFLIGARNRIVVVFSWLWSYITFQRGARLITGEEQPAPERPRAGAYFSGPDTETFENAIDKTEGRHRR